MPGCDQENESADDSRTAAVGPRSNQRSNRITKPSSQFARARRSARNSRLGHQNPQDFVPQGATFTTTSLPIDEESGSSPTQSSDTSESDDSQAEPELTLVKPMPNERAQAAVNWNNVARGAIRTSLRGSGAISASIPGSFDTVNGAFWRSRSASVSDPGNANMVESKPRGLGIQISNGISDNQSHPIVVSDDSELETDADADNAILLNLSSSNQNASDINDTTQELRIKGASEPFANGLDDRREHDAVLDHQQTSLEAAAIHPQSSNAKVEAVETFHSRYPSAPYILGDLSNEDRDIQLHFIYYNANPKDVNLNLPIRCTDCMTEGHLAEVCPYKECKHCGAWNCHESRFCPSWRRCQRCRKRGHDEDACDSLLKGLPSETPCDFCGSHQHIESECDLLWKVPKGGLSLSQIFISVCCSFCTSKQHLLGDCPSRSFPMESSSWTLNTIDPSMISDLSGKLISGDKDNKGRDEQLTGLRIKGRANEFVESDDNDGEFVGSSRWNPKQPQRSQIRVGSGIGRGRNLDGNPNRQEINTSDKYVPHDYRRKYRDRDPYPNRNNRLRSLSPDIYPPRQRNGGRAPARSPPRGRGRPPPSSSRGGSNKNRRGPPGRGRGKSDNRDVYRPMPSDAKRAWDKHRL